jgi:exodeoxyribonuclease VII small subunit
VAEPERFEEILERLQLIVDKLEGGKLSLEESLREFEAGVRLSRRGAALLDEAERKVEVLLQGADGQERVVPFADDEVAS